MGALNITVDGLSDYDPPIPVRYGDDTARPCSLLPETAFRPDGEDLVDHAALRSMYGVSEEETGPNSATVRWRFFSCTAGWPRPPGPADLYEALRADRPTPWQVAVICTWLREATRQELMLARVEEAYSWRVLVRAVHRVGYRNHRLNRYLNQFADPSRIVSKPDESESAAA